MSTSAVPNVITYAAVRSRTGSKVHMGFTYGWSAFCGAQAPNVVATGWHDEIAPQVTCHSCIADRERG